MRTYIGLSGRRSHMGGLYSCIDWGNRLVRANHTRVVKIACLRKGEPFGRLIAEITIEGCRFLPRGRQIKASQLINRWASCQKEMAHNSEDPEAS